MTIKKKIKLFDPTIGKEEETAVKKVLTSGFWASGAGTGSVQRFDKEFRNYINCDSCTLCLWFSACISPLYVFYIYNYTYISIYSRGIITRLRRTTA